MRRRHLFRFIRGLLIVLAVAAGVIALAAGLSNGIRWIWQLVPLGVAEIVLGSTVLAVTIYFSRNSRAFGSGIPLMERLRVTHFGQTLGILFGSAFVFAGAIWFAMPEPLLNALPPFKEGSLYFFVGILLVFGVGECVRIAVLSLKIYWLGSVFYFAVAGVVLWVLNGFVWDLILELPTDYFAAGAFAFASIIFVELAYLVLIKGIPAYGARYEVRSVQKSEPKTPLS